MKPIVSTLASVALLGALAVPVAAQDAPMCDLKHELDKHKLLRRLSLDLRDRIPTFEEYQALADHDAVPESMVDDMLASDDFRLAMRRYHAKIFWPNLSNIYFDTSAWRISTINFGSDVYDAAANTRREIYRGSYDNCGEFEHTTYDSAFPGEFRPLGPEGWRWMTPWWDPETPIKVCASVAQETLVANGVTCADREGFNEPACGCGTNMRYCHSASKLSSRLLNKAFIEQINRAVDHVTVDGAPYTDLVLATQTDENALIAMFMNHSARATYELTYFHEVPPGEPHANLAYDAEGWVAVDRGAPHAGVLTMPAFLMRFPTNRARLNRFRSDFMCEGFIPQDELIAQPGCSDSSEDLTERCHCQHCHQTIEPEAAHFGLFTERGFAQMSDLSLFPRFDEECIGANAVQRRCRRFYITRDGEHAPGTLGPWQWAEKHADIAANLESGPLGLATRSVEDGSFARCTVRRAFERLIKREPRVTGEDVAELGTYESLTSAFRDSGYNYRQLVTDIVSLPQYREVR